MGGAQIDLLQSVELNINSIQQRCVSVTRRLTS